MNMDEFAELQFRRIAPLLRHRLRFDQLRIVDTKTDKQLAHDATGRRDGVDLRIAYREISEDRFARYPDSFTVTIDPQPAEFDKIFSELVAPPPDVMIAAVRHGHKSDPNAPLGHFAMISVHHWLRLHRAGLIDWGEPIWNRSKNGLYGQDRRFYAVDMRAHIARLGTDFVHTFSGGHPTSFTQGVLL